MLGFIYVTGFPVHHLEHGIHLLPIVNGCSIAIDAVSAIGSYLCGIRFFVFFVIIFVKYIPVSIHVFVLAAFKLCSVNNDVPAKIIFGEILFQVFIIAFLSFLITRRISFFLPNPGGICLPSSSIVVFIEDTQENRARQRVATSRVVNLSFMITGLLRENWFATNIYLLRQEPNNIVLNCQYFYTRQFFMNIHSKLPTVGTTIFTVMSRLATEHNAINLGQGFPAFPMSEELVALVNEAMKNNFNQYPPMPGWLPLREAIAEKIEFLYKTKTNPDTEITITPGGTYAIYSSLTAILQPGDEVIVFEPAYDSYIPNVEINGAKAIPINLIYPGYKIDWAAVKNAINPKTKAIILNSPHNPTGSVIGKEDIDQLRSVVKTVISL